MAVHRLRKRFRSALRDEVAATVERESGVRLEPEVVFLGDWPAEPDR